MSGVLNLSLLIMRNPLMKRSSLVRLLNLVAVAICLGNWYPHFLNASYEGAWEWNSLSLLALVHGVSSEASRWFPGLMYGYSFQIVAVAAAISGCLPLITGLLGSIHPKSKVLLRVSICSSAVVALSVIVLYSAVLALYGQIHRPIVEPGAGSYMVVVIITLEILAGVISLRSESIPN
jgi:hypothetical protein